jgi:hypothetical protein
MQAGDGWFAAAAVVAALMIGAFAWGGWRLEGKLGPESDATIKAAITDGSTDRITNLLRQEHAEATALKRVVRSGVRLGRHGATLTVLLLALGYLRRRTARDQAELASQS